LPVATSQSLILLSLPEASVLPSGLNATESTNFVCPFRVRRSFTWAADLFGVSSSGARLRRQPRAAARRLPADGYEPVLKHSRWCFLKRPEHLTDRQTVKLSELLQYNLQSVRAYLQQGDFQRFWEYRSPHWAGRFLDEWCTRVMRSRIEPMKRVARSLRSHRELLLNWFRAKGTISAGVVEGMNNKVKLTMRKSYGFRTPEAIQIALSHNLGALPEPELTHRFW